MTARWYAVAVLLAVGAAALVLWQLVTSESTDCFLNSAKVARNDGRPKGCPKEAADAVVNALRTPRAAAERSTPLETRSALAVWMALFAVTAAVAAFAAVRAVATVVELRPRWDLRLVAYSIGAVILVVLPLALFRALAQFAYTRFGPFDTLHEHAFQWLNPIVAGFTLPAVVGLVAVGRVVATQPGLGLTRLAELGARTRWLVGMLGTILSLAVLTTAARWQAIDTLPGGESVPSTVVLLWGGAFALVLGLLYVPVYQLWAVAATREIAEEVELQLSEDASPGTPGFRPSELALKKELAATLGLGGALRSLQGSVAVLAPVIAAAVSSLFA